jgi:hypothetical protein
LDKRRVGLVALVLLFVLCAGAAPAKADTIGNLSLTGCPGTGCPNATYSFDISSTQATLTIKVTSAPGTNDNEIVGVDLGFVPSNDIVSGSLSLVSNPGGTWGTVDTGSLSNGGCGGNGGAFVCASSTTGGVTVANGGTYTWVWDFTLASGSVIDSVGDVHIGANYDPANGQIVSQTGASVPEPGVLSLLGLGMLGLVVASRKRFAIN